MIPRIRIDALACVVGLLLLAPSSTAEDDEFAALTVPAQELARQVLDAKGRRLAVVDFSDLSGRGLELGRAIAEEVASVLVRDGKPLQVIDRLSMAALLKEHRLTQSALIDPKTTREFGRISGVDVLVTGSITPLGDTVRVTLKAIDTETATMLGSATARIERTTAIDRLLRLEAGTGGSGGSQAESSGDYEGSARFERFRNLDVRLESLQVLKNGEIVAALRLRNARTDQGRIALAVKAEMSDGLADFWKFFPKANAYITDDRGQRYPARSVQGMGYARQKSDWTFLQGSDEIPVTFNFSGGSDIEKGRSFSVVIEFWYAEKSGGGQPLTVTFRNVIPK